MVALETTSDARTNGLNHLVANGNIHAGGTISLWGTFRVEVAGGGVWEGVWNGKRNLLDQSMTLSGVGHGRGGHC